MTVRVLIADDEAPARAKLRAHLARVPSAELAGEATDGLEAVEALRTLEPDLVFLDVRMPGLSGFEVIDAVGLDRMPPVVFVTAHDEFAVEAFEVQAIDYLLKPFDQARFERAFRRAAERVGARAAGRAAVGRLLERVGAAVPHLERLVVREGRRHFFVPVAEIARITASENYVEIHTRAGASHLLRDTLARIESRLDPARFARVHRSEIVRLDLVREVRSGPHGDGVLVLDGGDEVRVSRRFQHRVLGRGSR